MPTAMNRSCLCDGRTLCPHAPALFTQGTICLTRTTACWCYSQLQLRLNSISGTFPSVLSGLSSLVALDLSENPITGGGTTCPAGAFRASLACVLCGAGRFSGAPNTSPSPLCDGTSCVQPGWAWA